MSKETNIQWCDSTENPVMGCVGCPLYPSSTYLVAIEISKQLLAVGTTEENARILLKKQFGELLLSELYQQRDKIGKVIASALMIQGISDTSAAARIVTQGIASHLRCYAAVLHTRYGSSGDQPAKARNPGYAPRFEVPKLFPGRMAKAAKMPDLADWDREDKPWLKGMPRLIFVSDMGDALSQDVPFDYLKQEIVDVAVSDNGSRHVWLWLTKRPRQMAEFYGWLNAQGVPWPRNLVPMTSVLNQDMAVHVKHLKRIPAVIRGLSVEPLWEEVDIDLDGIDWVIVGGESGPHAKPFQLSWARALRDRCDGEGKAFFMKQLGKRPHEGDLALKLCDEHGGDWTEWPDDLRVRQVPRVFSNLVGQSVEAPPPVDFAANAIGCSDFMAFHEIVVQGITAFMEAGEALEQIRDRKLWSFVGFPSWDAYCNSIVGLTKRHANRIIRAAGIAGSLSQAGPTGPTPGVVAPRNESQLRPLFKLKEPGQQQRAWSRACEIAGGQPTAAQVSEAVVKIADDPRPVPQRKLTLKIRLQPELSDLMDRLRGGAGHAEIEARLAKIIELVGQAA